MKLAYAALAALALSVAPAFAQEAEETEETEAAAPDEVEQALAAALEAYKAGDIAMAAEEADYARQLMAQMKAQQLSQFLPEPMEGWTREEGESGGMPGLGGMMASAAYIGPENGQLDVQIMADNQMVASMMMMFNNPMMIGQLGELKRIGRQKVILTNEGELQAMLDNNVLITISGDAPADVKQEYFQRIDIEALQDF